MRVAGGWTGAGAVAPDFQLLVVAVRLAQAATPTARLGAGIGPRRAADAPVDRLPGRDLAAGRSCRFSAIPDQGDG